MHWTYLYQVSWLFKKINIKEALISNKIIKENELDKPVMNYLLNIVHKLQNVNLQILDGWIALLYLQILLLF